MTSADPSWDDQHDAFYELMTIKTHIRWDDWFGEYHVRVESTRKP